MTVGGYTVERTVVELEFGLEGSDLFFVSVSDGTSCELELETVVPRSDGTVLEFVTVRGTEPAEALELLEESPGIREVQLLHDDEALFELVSESKVATALADEEALLKGFTASGGRGTLSVEVPPHIDVSNVIERFLLEYPDAELLARRKTNRRVPLVSEFQFETGILSELTEKQRRALRVAHANGYFEFPRRHNADEIAGRLGVSTPTFSQHLRVAERKVLDTLF